MARSILGNTGSITIPAGVGNPQDATDFAVRRWTATFDREILDDNALSDADNWFKGVGGMYNLTGSCEGQAQSDVTMGIYDFGTAGQAATSGFVLTSFSSCTYTFAGLITRLNVVTPKTGLIIFTVDFVSSGTITVD